MKRISRTSAARPEWTLRAMSGQQRPRHSAGRRSRSDSGARPGPAATTTLLTLMLNFSDTASLSRRGIRAGRCGGRSADCVTRARRPSPTALQPHRCPQVRGDIDGLAVFGVEVVDAARAIADDLAHDAGHSKINPQPHHSAGHCQRRPSIPWPAQDHYREGDRPKWALQCRA